MARRTAYAKITLDRAALHRLLESRTGDVGRAMQGVAGRVTIAARTYAATQINVRTGRYLASLRTTFIDGNTFLLYTLSPYGGYIEFGTAPHVIAARNARFLRFEARDGSILFRQFVNHPGTEAHHILDAAVLLGTTKYR
jgi:hypothetical protein